MDSADRVRAGCVDQNDFVCGGGRNEAGARGPCYAVDVCVGMSGWAAAGELPISSGHGLLKLLQSAIVWGTAHAPSLGEASEPNKPRSNWVR